MEEIKNTPQKSEADNVVKAKSKKGLISIKIKKCASYDLLTGWMNSGWSKHGGWNHLKW